MGYVAVTGSAPTMEDTVPTTVIGQKTVGTTKLIASAVREYVSGDVLQWYTNVPRALPWALDEIAEDFGLDIYERMLVDPQVRAGVNVLKSGILERGVRISSAISDRLDPDFDLAMELVDGAERTLDGLDQPLDDVLWDLFDAVAVGNRVAEQSFEVEQSYTGKQEWALHRLAVKPQQSYAFVVDAYRRIIGLLVRMPGQPFPVQVGTWLLDIAATPNIMPRSKFAILSFRPRNMDPRGSSVLRSAFKPWNMKQQMHAEYLKYLSQFATPSLLGFTAEGAQPYQQTDAEGNIIEVTPEEAMLRVLESFANGTAAVFPFGSDVRPLLVTGEGRPFLEAEALFNTEIVKAILHQTLATEEGQHMSRAASTGHKDILDRIIRQARRSGERILGRDVLSNWIRFNYGEEALRVAPIVTMGSAEQEDVPSLMIAVSRLHTSGFLHKSQYAGLDKQLNLPERSEPEASTIPVTETIRVQDAGSKETAGEPDPGEGATEEGPVE